MKETKRPIFSQSISLTQYVVFSACPSVPVSFIVVARRSSWAMLGLLPRWGHFFYKPIRPPPDTGDTHSNIILQTQHHGKVSDKCNDMELSTFKKHNPPNPLETFCFMHQIDPMNR